MNAIVAAPYGLGLARKDADYEEARALEEILFRMLCDVLNEEHGIQYSERQWRIILGRWLYRYVDVMLNRVKTLQQCLGAHQISGTSIYKSYEYALVTPDSHSAILALNNDVWNNILYGRILNYLDSTTIKVEKIESAQPEDLDPCSKVPTITLTRAVLRWARNQVANFFSLFVRDTDALIIGSYLPEKVVIKLQLICQQWPQFWRIPKFKSPAKPNKALRDKLSKKYISKHTSNNLVEILNLMLFELLPTCYLEDFKKIDRFSEQQGWPKTPKFIFTSNNFDTDEVFKIWVAKKITIGSKYIVGQHGNHYGTYRYMNPSIEEVTADKFLTWGWSDELPQHTPAFIFKNTVKKAERCNPKGGLLLVESCVNHRITTWDDTFEFDSYFKDQQKFITFLDCIPKQKLIVRLHPSYRTQNWHEEKRWQAFDPALQVELCNADIGELISRSRLVVHSYDSTGFLETLSQNIPTLAFWQNELDHLRENARPYFQMLVDVGILHFTPESVAQKVNAVWHDVDNWWEQKALQDTRIIFCERYGCQNKHPLYELKKILIKDL
jgi:putative transferase (TIGR04331 family)